MYLILPNQLFDIKYLGKDFRENHYVLWECPHFFTAYKYNQKKLLLHRASMQYYFDYLKSNGCRVSYVQFFENLEKSEYTLFDPLNKLEILDLPSHINIISSPNLLLSSELLQEYNKKTDKFFFNAFYMWSKTKLGIIPKIKSQDALNRKRLGNHQIISQPFEKSDQNKYVLKAKEYIKKHFKNNYGNCENFIYPITHKDALKWLDHFISNKFKQFGPYQDFIDKDDAYLYHSLLSALLNVGLLCPLDIIRRIEKVKSGVVPLSSYEGFIRQLFWREYQYYCYKYYDFTKKNYFGNKKKLGIQWYTGSTGVLPVDDAIKEAFASGYLHHIKRLMIIGNYMNLCEINPQEGFRWFMEFSCDSYEWVMHQNVYDMVFCVSGGATMRRPYLSSSNYVLKMSNYKKDAWCDLWDDKYRTFIAKKKTKLWKFRYYIRIAL
jgi:deoxyribodipyrimidine photolyase-related protein